MQKIILAIVLLLIGGFFINVHFEGEAKRKAEELETKRFEEVTRRAVKKMVSRTKAVDDWVLYLKKGKQYSSLILTMDLETVWLTNRPILFVGVIKDIATQDNFHYTIQLESGFLNNSYYLFGIELEVSLRASKEMIDSFLKKHPDLDSYNNGIAVIAQINSIRRAYSIDDEVRTTVRIGEGELLDIQYVGNIPMKKLDITGI